MWVQETEEAGFTLIEILMVILIIGILTAIAIPVFLNQRKVANDAAMVSDLKNSALAVETYFVNNPDAPSIQWADIADQKLSKGSYFAMRGTVKDWCIVASNTSGNFTGFSATKDAITYDPFLGGIQSNGFDWHSNSKCGNDAVGSWSWKRGS